MIGPLVAAASPRQPARTVAAASPPWVPMPGMSSGKRGDQARDVCGGLSAGFEPLLLQVGAAGVRGAAEQEHALALVAQVGLDRIQAEKGRQRDRIGAVAVENFARVVLGRRPDIAALGVEDYRHAGGAAVDVGDEALELRFGAMGGEVGDR